MSKTPNKNEPLTVEEMTEAAEIFMPLYQVIASQLPKATVEDVLKVMESVAKLGHKRRQERQATGRTNNEIWIQQGGCRWLIT